MKNTLPWILLLAFGCFESRFAGDGGLPSDAGGFDVPRFDVPRFFDAPPGVDTFPGFDVGPREDAGPPRFDGGPPRLDGGPIRDVGPDSVVVDVGGEDAGPICDPRSCPVASGPECVDDNTLRVFGEPFCDEDFMCDLPVEDFVCERGCQMGRCADVCGQWTTDIVSGSGNSAGTTSLSIGSNAIYIAYSEGVANELRVANLRGGVWGLETVGRPNVSATPAEIVIDERDGLHTLYSPPSSTGLRYAFRTAAGAWRTAVVTTMGGRSVGTLAIDDMQTLHFLHRLNREVGYVRREDGSLVRSNIAGSGYAGPNSLAVFTRGGVATVFAVVSGSEQFPMPATLRFAERTGNGPWSVETLDGAATTPALAVDRAGAPYVVDFIGTELHLRVRRGGVWEEEFIDHGGFRGQEPDAAFDERGNLHLSYRDADNRQLRYAVRPPDGDWRFEIADETVGTGDDSSIGVSQAGVHISHQSDTGVRARGLRYTRFLTCI